MFVPDDDIPTEKVAIVFIYANVVNYPFVGNNWSHDRDKKFQALDNNDGAHQANKEEAGA